MQPAGGSICAFGGEVLFRYLQAMLLEAPGVRRGQDIEHIHRMRVASRRLRAALPLFATCFPGRKVDAWLKALRRVTRSLGEARDMDVQIEVLVKFLADTKLSQNVPGLRRLQVRWEQQRQEVQKKVLKSLDEMQESHVFEKMGTAVLPYTLGIEPGAPPQQTLYELGQRSIQPALESFLNFESIIFLPEKVAELHQMRIAAKQLRYTLETFAPLYPENLSSHISIMKNAQDLLGEIHDCDVWQEAIPCFLEEEKQRTVEFYGTPGPWNLLLPGVKAFLADRQKLRGEKYQTFLRKWQSWQEKQTWSILAETISAPLIDSDRLYPPAISQPNSDTQSEEV